MAKWTRRMAVANQLALLLAMIVLAGCGRETVPDPTVTPPPSPTTTSTILPATEPPIAGPTAALQDELPNPPAVPDATPAPPDLTIGECENGTRPCPDDYEGWLQRLSVPPGFDVRLYAALPEGDLPTVMVFSPDGQLYIATIDNPFEKEPEQTGMIWRLEGDVFVEYAGGFILPAGLAFDPGNGDLYISHRENHQSGALSRIPAGGGPPELVVSGLPCCYSPVYHQPNGIVFGPDGYIYMSIGARTDHGPPEDILPLEAGILRISPDGDSVEKYASGLRNPYDLAFDPAGQLWVADNSPDFGPRERLHKVEPGGHYGFPYYAAEGCEDCALLPDDLQVIPPYATFEPHATPTGILAYAGGQFPANYLNDVFVALWNPWATPGVWRVRGPDQVEPFVLGLFAPVDVVESPAGSLLVADFFFGHIFEVYWTGE